MVRHKTFSVIITYGASLWGTKEFSVTNKVQNCVCRFYSLALGNTVPIAVVKGHMGCQCLHGRWYLGRWKEGNVLFNDVLNTFYLRLYGVRHIVKDHSDIEKGNLLPLHELLFPINSKGSFICTIPQTG